MIVEELAAKFGIEVDEAQFSKLENALHGLHHGIMGVAGVFGAAIVAITAIVESTGEAGDQAARMAEKIGMNTQALQGLTFAAHLADVAADSLQSGLKFLGKNAAEAAAGSKELRHAFAQAGVQLTDATGKVRPIEELLGDVADHFQKMPAGAEKTALAMKLLGRGGIDMVPLLNKGSHAIKELREEADRLGLVMDEKTIKDSEEYADQLKIVGAALTGLKYAIGGPLLAQFSGYLKAISEFIVKNREAIATPIVKFAQLLGDAIHFLAGETTAARWVWFAFATFLVTKGVMALSAMEVGFGSLSLAATAAAIKSAAAWLAAVLPFAAIAAVIVLIIDDLYTFATDGESVLGHIIDWFSKVNPDDNNMIKAIKNIGSAITNLGGYDAWNKFLLGWTQAEAAQTDFWIGMGRRFGKEFAETVLNVLSLGNYGFAKTLLSAGGDSKTQKPLTERFMEAISPTPSVSGGGIPRKAGDVIQDPRTGTMMRVGANGQLSAIHLNVNVDARGNSNGNEIASKTATATENAMDRMLREALESGKGG